MGLFGGGNSKSSTSNIDNAITTGQVQAAGDALSGVRTGRGSQLNLGSGPTLSRITVGGSKGIGSGGSFNLNTLDGGAVSASFGFGSSMIDRALGLVRDALAGSERSSSASTAAVKAAYANAADASGNAGQLMRYGLAAAAVLVGLYVWKGSK